MFPCFLGCLTSAAMATNPWDTLSCCRPAGCQDGQLKFRCRWMWPGNATTLPAFAVLFVMEWTSHWRGCFCTRPELHRVRPKAKPGLEAASEAFLFRRLQTLPETKQRFRLNEMLPIVFDGSGQMEVDFLSAEAALVIELDGAQHLA